MPTWLETGPTMDLVIGMIDAMPDEALNWAVAWTLPTRADPKATLGSHLHWCPRVCTVWGGNRFDPTGDWRDLGLAIERTDIVLSNHFSPDEEADDFFALQEQRMDLSNYWGGAYCTPMRVSRQETWRGVKIAACRAIVSGWLIQGNKIPMPLQLLDPANVKPTY